MKSVEKRVVKVENNGNRKQSAREQLTKMFYSTWILINYNDSGTLDIKHNPYTCSPSIHLSFGERQKPPLRVRGSTETRDGYLTRRSKINRFLRYLTCGRRPVTTRYLTSTYNGTRLIISHVLTVVTCTRVCSTHNNFLGDTTHRRRPVGNESLLLRANGVDA